MPKAAPRLLPIPLHGGLSPEEQQAMFAPPPRDTRKVVVATNIAEASVTIEGIKYVIDSGFVKVGSAMECNLRHLTSFSLSCARTIRERAWTFYPLRLVPSRLQTNVPDVPAERPLGSASVSILHLPSPMESCPYQRRRNSFDPMYLSSFSSSRLSVSITLSDSTF